jgi:hypothetical protein
VKKMALLTTCLLLLVMIASIGVQPGAAQTAQPTAVATTQGTTVDAFVVMCADAVVVRFSGTMLSGWDIYYQAFNAPNGTGTALTNLRQVSVAGDFLFNERLAYTSGSTLATGATGSIKAFVARESNSASIDFDFTVNDINDGCTQANTTQPGTTGATSGSVDAGAGAAPAASSGSRPGFTTSLLAPNGGLLNPNLQPEASVVIGARPSDTFRSSTPGLLFAQCDGLPLAQPGIIYDNDNVVIFWSWFAKTLDDMNQHLANAQYSVTVNTARLNDVQRTEPVLRNRDYWVFYTYQAGRLRPGHYEIAYNLTWTQPISDGYDEFGPGTANPREGGTCNFDVTRNPENASVDYVDMFFPTDFPVHNITPND